VDYLFDWIEKILTRLKSAQSIFFFLDYDGTLTPIVPHPEQAILSEKTKTLLLALKRNPKFLLAIVSGRSLKDIRNLVGLKNIYYVGNHGLEIFMPRRGIKQIISEEIFQGLSRIRKRLNHLLKDVDGIYIEDKGCILAIHYRNVDPGWVPSILKILAQEVKESVVPFSLSSGKKVFEIRPRSFVNKGTAVSEILRGMGPNGTLPVYIGDDQTDEDAFNALKRKGMTIVVGVPSNSLAHYNLKDPSEVHEFLKIVQKELG